MQNQVFYRSTLGFQRFVQRTNYKITGDTAVCYACHYAPVIKICDGAVISGFPAFREQVCEIVHHLWFGPAAQKFCASRLANTLCGFPIWHTGFLRHTAEHRWHIFMDRCRAVMDAPAFQVNAHGYVA